MTLGCGGGFGGTGVLLTFGECGLFGVTGGVLGSITFKKILLLN